MGARESRNGGARQTGSETNNLEKTARLSLGKCPFALLPGPVSMGDGERNSCGKFEASRCNPQGSGLKQRELPLNVIFAYLNGCLIPVKEGRYKEKLEASIKGKRGAGGIYDRPRLGGGQVPSLYQKNRKRTGKRTRGP